MKLEVLVSTQVLRSKLKYTSIPIVVKASLSLLKAYTTILLGNREKDF